MSHNKMNSSCRSNITITLIFCCFSYCSAWFFSNYELTENGLEVIRTRITGRSSEFDSQAEFVSYNTNKELITGIRLYYLIYDDSQYLTQLEILHGDHSDYDAKKFTSDQYMELKLRPTEFITAIRGERTSLSISMLQFETSEGRSVTVGNENRNIPFSIAAGGGPLLYLNVNMGIWVYQLQATFLAYRVTHHKIRRVAESLAEEILNALKSDVGELKEIYNYHTWMLPDIARRSCLQYTIHQNTDYKVACELEYMLNQLSILHVSTEAFMNHKPRQIMSYRNYDTKQLLKTAKEAKDFHNVIAKIINAVDRSADQVTRIAANITFGLAGNIGKYFHDTADFEKNIATNDMNYITSKLNSLKSNSSVSFKKVGHRLGKILKWAVGINAADVTQRGVQLATTIASSCNPFSWIFGNPVSDLIAATDAVSESANNLASSSALLASLHEFLSYMKNINNRLSKNPKQQAAMREIVMDFNDATKKEQNSLIAKFVSEHGDYTPPIAQDELAYAVQLLQTVASTGCELFNAGSSAAANVMKGVGGSDKHCLLIHADISKLASINEQFFDFQNELVSTFSKIMRASIATNMAEDISTIQSQSYSPLTTVTIASMMVEIAYQAKAHARCMELEYINGGKRPFDCQHLIFSDLQIDRIIAFTGGSIDSTENPIDAYIPTQRSGPNEQGPWMDFDSFLKGEEYALDLANQPNIDWLIHNGWLWESDLLIAPEATFYIEGFEVYVPGVHCESGENVDFTITAESSQFTRLFSKTAPASYVLSPTTYTFKYNEYALGNLCSGNEGSFRVKNHQNSTVTSPQVCIISSGSKGGTETDVGDVLPSLFSIWKLKLVTRPLSCKLMRDDPTITPMITVRLRVIQKNAEDINDCWPDKSRCPAGKVCVDKIMDYDCQ